MRRFAFLAPLLLAACATTPSTQPTPSYRAATESCRATAAAQMAKDDPQNHAGGNEGTTAQYAAIYEKCMRDAGWGSALTPPSPPQPPLPPPTPPIMPPSAAATDGSAEVTITSEPPLAEIWVDGRFVGSAPVKLPLTPGAHAIEARRSGFANWKRDLSVTAGVPARVVALLER
jgi:hypothetical protein